jgi:5'-methylthioadenosine phosphorylase
MSFAVIGGTGCYDFLSGEVATVEVATPYGAVTLDRGRVEGVEVVFLPRHGKDHRVPPHRINYRANIAALRDLGVKNILASAAVGTMRETMPPGSLAALTQFLDFTRGRASTFYDGADGKVVHTDMTQPYCPHLREELLAAAQGLGEHLHPGAVYVCAEGPRFETPAEIRMFQKLGGDLVGMTGVPEAVLAREAGLCYASVAIATNWAAGASPEKIAHKEVSDFMEQHTPRVVALFKHVIRSHTEIACACREQPEA